EGGSGNISPNGFTCSVSTSGFLRVRAHTSNQCVNGEAYVFYLLNGSGYRMASPNPTKGDKVKVEFVDKQLADDLLNSMVLYNEKEKVMWSFDKASAKTNKHFKDKDFVEIETKDLSKGLYYLHLQIGEKKYIERLGVE
ncbi:MAG: hypothetical protein MUE30_16785, partial [Spirosomaceae bacterium]|nr:hypothetical protein [Spirosomataceae bacterium]